MLLMASVFSERLKARRKELGLTQNDVAKALGLTQTAVWAYEAGTREPDLDTIARLAGVLGVTVDYLFGRQEGPPGDLETKRKELVRSLSHPNLSVDERQRILDELKELERKIREEAPPLPGYTRVELLGARPAYVPDEALPQPSSPEERLARFLGQPVFLRGTGLTNDDVDDIIAMLEERRQRRQGADGDLRAD